MGILFKPLLKLSFIVLPFLDSNIINCDKCLFLQLQQNASLMPTMQLKLTVFMHTYIVKRVLKSSINCVTVSVSFVISYKKVNPKCLVRYNEPSNLSYVAKQTALIIRGLVSTNIRNKYQLLPQTEIDNLDWP